MGKRQKRGHGGSRKIGRNKIKCERYQRENRRVKNKIKKIARHLKRHFNDYQSAKYLQNLTNS